MSPTTSCAALKKVPSEDSPPRTQQISSQSRKPLAFELYMLQEWRDRLVSLPEGEEEKENLPAVESLILEIEGVQRYCLLLQTSTFLRPLH